MQACNGVLLIFGRLLHGNDCYCVVYHINVSFIFWFSLLQGSPGVLLRLALRKDTDTRDGVIWTTNYYICLLFALLKFSALALSLCTLSGDPPPFLSSHQISNLIRSRCIHLTFQSRFISAPSYCHAFNRIRMRRHPNSGSRGWRSTDGLTKLAGTLRSLVGGVDAWRCLLEKVESFATLCFF
jgi:hypothetical protein